MTNTNNTETPFIVCATFIREWLVKTFPELLDDTELDGSEVVDRLTFQLEVLNDIIKPKE